MQVIRIREPGPPDVLEPASVPRPEPASGTVRVRVAASGVNRADLVQRLGRYPAPDGYPQDIPGMEFSGVVDRVGDGVSEAWTGRSVMGITGGGGYAEYVIAFPDELLLVPASMDLVTAAAIPEAFMTAYDAVLLQARLNRDELLLVHAVGSGVGTAALQLGLRLGAEVVGTSRTSEKLEAATELGLKTGIEGGDDWADAMLDATGGRQADVVLDLVGGAYLEGNQRVLGHGGRHIVVGIPGGARASVNLGTLMRRRATLRGTVLRSRPLSEKIELARAFEEDVLPGFSDGALTPVVDRAFEARDAPAAHHYMEENRNFGKILLSW
ncbi:MAG: NAD(P)H-quinone oxidoreductase [Gemmatimonadota bacterium]|nr:NAD(P)H-quinone oxidoreductase [Gemmatimonadota bacterium]